jgi:ubiquinone/menaquinone biosynthesis C-methylase UbiE
MSPADYKPVQVAVTEFWNAVAPYYESFRGNTAPFGSDAYSRWSTVYQHHLPSRSVDLLDVCCGTGFAALICASLGHRVTGIDLAPNMLAIARGLAQERGLVASFAEGDAVKPLFADESFDVVVSRHSLWTLREPRQALRNWHQLLRPGGKVILIDAFHSWDMSKPPTEQERYFNQYYTPDVRAALPFMQLQSETPLLAAFTEARFCNLAFELLAEELSDALGYREYALIAYR